MEDLLQQKRRPRRTAAEIEKLMAEFSSGSLKAGEFCSHHKISGATFSNWKSKYLNLSGMVPEQDGFNTIQLTATALFAEVKGIKVYQLVPAAYLKELAGI